MTEVTPEIIERALRDKYFWKKLAAEIIAESSQNMPRENSDSAIAEIGVSPLPLGRILESHSPQRTRVRLPLPGSGPRMVPMIAEVNTLSPEGGVLLSQGQARRLRRQWDRGRLRGQSQSQHLAERGDAAGEEEEEEGSNPMQDHPGQNCSDAHAGMSHDEFLDQQEEEEEERQRPSVNPLFRNPRNSFDTSRRRQR